MATRAPSHRRAILRDRDALQAILVTLVVLMCSAGMLLGVYLVRAWRTAHHAPARAVRPGVATSVLLFGKRSVAGVADADFLSRIERTYRLTQQCADIEILLLGGGPAPTEAEIAQCELRLLGVTDSVPLILEHESRDTLENLRHARELLGRRASRQILLVSNRYHLPRCSMLADQIGIPHQLCAAESRWRSSPQQLARLLGESAYLMLIDTGARWARLTGQRRMLARLH